MRADGTLTMVSHRMPTIRRAVAQVVLLSLVVSLVAIAAPAIAPSGVAEATISVANEQETYKEIWVDHREFAGGCDSEFRPQGYNYLEPSPCDRNVEFDIVDDFSQAIRIEVYLDLWRNRDNPRVKFRVNGNAPYQPDVGTDWGRTPWVGEVPMEEFVQGTNTMRFTSFFPVHVKDIAIRIYYDDANPLIAGTDSDVTPPSGELTSIIANGNAFDPGSPAVLDVDSDQLQFTATAADDVEVDYVEFIGFYEGYDIDGDGVTREWQATFRNNYLPGGLQDTGQGGLINHIGTDAEAPYAVDWDLGVVPNQEGVKFKVRVVDTAGNVTEAAGGASADFSLQRTRLVETYTIPNFEDAVLHHDGEFPDVVQRSIELPEDLTGVTRAFLVANYWERPFIQVNGNRQFRSHIGNEDHWELSVKEIPIGDIGPGVNDLTYSYSGSGFGQFIEKPGPMVVLYRDIPPLAVPTILTQPSNVTVSENLPAAFSVEVDGSPPPSFQWMRNGIDIVDATESTYTTGRLSSLESGAQYSVRVSNNQGSVTSNPATVTVAPTIPWAAGYDDWPYRLEVVIDAAGYERVDKIANVGINFTEQFIGIGENGPFDPRTVRVLEVNSGGTVLEGPLQYQFDGVTDYDATDNADGNLVFTLTGTTAATQSRRYHVYFAQMGSGIPPLEQDNIIEIIDNVVDEGQSGFRIETPSGVWDYQKDAGGFSSLVDTDGNDWIGFDDAIIGASGTFRGLPNAVFPEGSFHPGAIDSRSEILNQGPLKTTFRTTTLDGRFGMRWDVYPTYVTATVSKARAEYWFLYEGQPGGNFGGGDRIVRSTGDVNFLGGSWEQDLPFEEWVYFEDGALDRSLFLVHHDNDNAVDHYSSLDNQMTVFGFGRRTSNPQLRRSGQKFSIGLMDTKNFGVAQAHIRNAYRDLTINFGLIERPAGAGLAGAPTNGLAEPGDAQALVTWDEITENGGAVLTGHTIVTSPADIGPVVVPGDATSAIITGLNNGTTYTFTIAGVNRNGVGAASDPTDPIVVSPLAAFQSDDFNRLGVGSTWEVIDPNTFDIDDEVFFEEEYPLYGFPESFVPDIEQAADIDVTGQELLIKVPAGASHDLWTDALFAPRVLQEVPDTDFQVEASFATVPTELFQFQGFMAQQDFRNFVRFDILYSTAGGYADGVLKVQAAKVVDGIGQATVEELVLTGDARYLRVTRAGDVWSLEYSIDGTTWELAGSFSHALDVTQAGMFAGNTANVAEDSPEWISRVDYVFNTSAPIVPEDGITDVSPLQITDIELLPSDDRVALRFRTSKLTTARVRYGTEPANGSPPYSNITEESDELDVEHTVFIDQLDADTQYYFRIEVTDLRPWVQFSPEQTTTTLPSGSAGSIIDVWAGLFQSFGHNGQPQRWINVLGNAADVDGIDRAYFTIGDGEQRDLTIGSTDRRLANEGDFNVDIGFHELFTGVNTIIVSIVDFYGNVVSTEIELDVAQGNTWELPYSVDWDTVSEVSDVAQIVDGDWEVVNGELRNVDVGYDRLVSIGDTTWTDYQVTVPVTIDAIDPSGYEFPSSGPAVGVGLRWPGHYDWDGSQPRYGFYPLGSLGWYRFQVNEIERLVLSNERGLNSTAHPTFQMEIGTTYIYKMSVQTEVTGDSSGHRYTLTVWEEGEPEQTGVTISDFQPITNLQSGSVFLVAHHVNARFGDVDVVRINQAYNPQISPASGEFTDGQTVTISTAAPNATVRYTLDGSQPTSASKVYTGPFEVNVDAQVRALAIREGVDVSGVSSANYSVRTSAPIVSDDFSSGRINDDLWTVIDPRADTNVVATDQQMQLAIPGGGSHDLFTNRLLAPRVLQSAPNDDFQIEAKFDSAFGGTFTMQGLIVQQTFRDFLRIDIYRNGPNRRMFVGKFIDGVTTPIADGPVTITGDFFIRLTREKSNLHTFVVEWSDDGVVWNQHSTFRHPMAVTSVGFWTGTHSNTGLSPQQTTSVDYFFNTASPIVPEDGVTPANVEPFVDAGPNTTVTIPNAVTLDGTLVDDGLVASPTYLWEHVSGPSVASIASPSAIDTTATFMAPGLHVVSLTVDDGEYVRTDYVEIFVSNAPGAPEVSAGAAQKTTTALDLDLNGTASDDGSPGPLVVTWSVDSGPGTVTFADGSSPVTTAQFSAPGTYLLRLQGFDGANTSFDLIEIEVVEPRETDGLIALYDFADLDGNVVGDVSLFGDPLDLKVGNVNSVVWNRDSLLLENTVTLASFETATKISQAVKQTNELTVETWVRPASLGQSGPARIMTLSNGTTERNFTLGQGPNGANSGREIDARLRTTEQSDNGVPAVTTGNVLNEGLQHIVYTRDAAGNASIYLDGVLVQSGVTAGDFSNWDDDFYLSVGNEYGGSRSFLGEYSLLAIYDQALDSSEVASHFQHGAQTVGGNVAPLVDAGPDFSFDLPAPQQLEASVVDDRRPTRNGLIQNWELVSGPAPVEFDNVKDPNTFVTFTVEGTYVLRITANDGEYTVSDEVVVNVFPDDPPTVDVGDDQLIEIISEAVINAAVSDDSNPEDQVLTTTWSVVSGPGTATFSDPEAAQVTVVFDTIGIYELRLTVADAGHTVTDDITVEVVNPPRAFDGLVALYGFEEGSGDTVRDVSGIGVPLDLDVEDPGNVTWGDGTLTIDAATRITSPVPATKIVNTARATSDFTIEAWIQPDEVSPALPGRILALGPTYQVYDVVLTQGYHLNQPTNVYRTKLITSVQSSNPVTAVPDTEMTHLVYTRDDAANRNYLFVNGELVDDRSSFGDLIVWDNDYHLTLGNEQTGGFPWLGTYELVAFYNRPLAANEVFSNFLAGPDSDGPPVVEAGDDILVQHGTAAIIDATASDDGQPDPPGVLDLTWTVDSGPGTATFSPDNKSEDVTVTFDTPGTYVLRLEGFDGSLASSDTMTVESLGNAAPIVNLTAVPVLIEDTATLPLEGAFTDEGLPLVPGAVTTTWSATGPGTVTFGDVNALITTADFGSPGTYTLTLSADDGALVGVDSVTVEVASNQPPVVDAGTGSTVTLVDAAVLDGSFVDDGLPFGTDYDIAWTQVSGPSDAVFADAEAVQTTATFDRVGQYEFRLTVADDEFSDSDTVLVSVNVPNRVGEDLVALYGFDAGSGNTVFDISGVGTPLNLDIANPGNVSWVPGGLEVNAATAISTVSAAGKINDASIASGEITIEAWLAPDQVQPAAAGRIVSIGTGVQTGNADIGQGYFTGQATDIYRSRATTSGTILHPFAVPVTTSLTHIVYTLDTNDGAARMYINGDLVISRDVTGDLSSWSALAPLTVASAGDGSLPWLGTLDLVAVYSRALTAVEVDTNYLGGADTQLVPSVDVGPDRSVGLPTGGTVDVAIDATATDDGQPDPPGALSYQWSVEPGGTGSGPVVFSSPTAEDTTATFSSPGSYIIRLSAADGGPIDGFDDLVVTVLANVAPTVDAGPDRSVESTGGALSVDLDGSYTDDGLPDPPGDATVAWSYLPGPSTGSGSVSISDSAAVDPTVDIGAGDGTYVFELTVDDGELQAADQVIVTISSNQAPTVDAGDAAGILVGGTLPLDGTVDDDGLPEDPGTVSTNWTEVSGPGTPAFADAGSVDTTVVFDVAGTYTLRLTADDGDLTTTDTVVITVSDPPPNTYDLRALYLFNEASGSVVADVSGIGTPLDLTIQDPGNVTWGPGSLTINSNTALSSVSAASKINAASIASGQVSIEAWVAPSSGQPVRPGRVVSIGTGPTRANADLGQGYFAGQATDIWRSRATVNGSVFHPYGTPLTTALTHVVYTLDTDTGLTRVYLDGVLANQRTTSGDLTNWNPAALLTLGNDAAGVYEWLGTFHKVAIYGEAIPPAGVADLFATGSGGQLAPIVNAGLDQTVEYSSGVMSLPLDGTVSDDGEPSPPGTLTTLWEFVPELSSGSGSVTFDNAAAVDTDVNIDAAGTYVLRLTADDSELSNSDELTITLTGNNAPIVLLPATMNATTGMSTLVDATVTDDGLPTSPGALTYNWEYRPELSTGDGTVLLSSPTAEDTDVEIDDDGVYVLRLTVNDGAVSTSADITITASPSSRVTNGLVALFDFAEGSGTTVTDTSGFGTPMNLTVADPGNTSWGSGDLTITSATEIATSGPATKVIDALQATNEFTIEAWVTPASVSPALPGRIVAISENQNIRNVVLGQGFWTSNAKDVWDTRTKTTAHNNNAFNSSPTKVTTELTHVVMTRDVGGMLRLFVDGVQVRTKFSSGTLATWSDAQRFLLGNDSAGGRGWLGTYHLVAVYDRDLTVSDIDANLASGPDAGPPPQQPPSVDAGADQTVEYANGVVTLPLDATVTDDGAPTPPGVTTSLWEFVPELSTGTGFVSFGNPLATDTTVSLDAAGTYVLRLTADDSALATVDEVTITLTSNGAPTVSLPVSVNGSTGSEVLIDATGTDDGLPSFPGALSYSWEYRPELSTGGGSVVLSSPTTEDTGVTIDADGTYVLRLTVDDGVLTASADVSVTVSSSSRVTTGLVVLYDFGEGNGTTVLDRSGVGTPMDLTIADPGNTTWGSGQLTIDSATEIATAGAGTKVIDAVKATGEFTIEAWVTPDSATPADPGRIVAISENQNLRNVVLGQGFWTSNAKNVWDTRSKTTVHNNNAFNSGATKVTTALSHVVMTRDAGGRLRLYVNGTQVATRLSSGDLSNWSDTYRFLLGNDAAGGRGWLGTYHLVAVYDRDLDVASISTNYAAGSEG